MTFNINSVNNNSNTPIYLTQVSLSSSDILNLATTPKLLIPAPGSGYANVPFLCWTESSTGTAYSGGGNLKLCNVSLTGLTLTNTIFILLNGTSAVNSTSLSVTSTSATYANLNNQAIYLYNPNSAYSGGTQTAQVWIKYFTIQLV